MQNKNRSKKTHCIKGHELTPDNEKWRVNANGTRYRTCKTCYLGRSKTHYRSTYKARIEKVTGA